MRIQTPCYLQQRVRVQLVVVIEQHDELSAGNGERLIRRRRNAATLVGEHHTNPGIRGCRLEKILTNSGIGRPIVRDAQLPIQIVLSDH